MEEKQSYAANNKRIAKNTLMLYFRMLLTMGVSLYTSRVILEALGIEDYGIYQVVGGLVAMFTMISGSLSAAISRFITFELGRGDQQKLNQVFSTSVVIQLVISVLIVVLIESVGIWFLEHKMQIPLDRLSATKWVLHFSMIALLINLISVPYNAAIIAHERMSAFAYMSIVNVMLKLGVSYLVMISPIDTLIFYSLLIMSISLTMRLIYGVYCARHFEECQHFSLSIDRAIFKEMFAFAGWNTIGSISGLLRGQGVSILLNMFFGPLVNAAQGISNQVTAVVSQFSSNFMMAVNPQITKSYAAGDRTYMMKLIFQGCRLSCYMMLMISLPILLNTSYILSLWLKEVPDLAVIFVQLSLLFGLIEGVSNPLITSMLATGNIRNYQIVVGGLLMMNLPLSYLLLYLGFPAEVVMVVAIGISLCCLTARLYMLRGMIGLQAGLFVRKVVLNVLMVSLVAVALPFTLSYFVENNFMVFVLISLTSLLCTALSIYFIGCNQEERLFVNQKIIQFKAKVFKK